MRSEEEGERRLAELQKQGQATTAQTTERGGGTEPTDTAGPPSPGTQPQQAEKTTGEGEARVAWSERPATVTTGAQENPRFEAVYGKDYQKPYADEGKVVTAPTDNDRFTSSRLYQSSHGEGEVSHPIDEPAAKGRWSTDVDPLQHTPEQLQQMSALPSPPNAIADRRHPQGQTLSKGEAGENDMGPGGGPQIEARDKREGERNTPRADWNPADETWDLRPSGIFNRASNPQNYEHEQSRAGRGDMDNSKPGEPAAPSASAPERTASAPPGDGPTQSSSAPQQPETESPPTGRGPASSSGIAPPAEPTFASASSGSAPAILPPTEPNLSAPAPSQPSPQTPPREEMDR